MNDNWVIRNLENALATWNDKLSEVWSLVTQTPETFKGGQIWSVITNINSALVGIGYGLLVLFFAMGVFQSAASFRDLQRPESALRHFIRFAAAKVAVGYGMEIMTAIFGICGGVVETVMGGVGAAVTQTATLPAEIVSAIEDVGFMESIPLWLVSFLGSLFITVMSFILILTVYGRFFKLYLYSALSPLPLATFAGEGTSTIGKSFIKSYVGVCMEGAVIVLACLIYSAFLSSDAPAVDTTLPAVTIDILPIPTDEAVKEVQNIILGVETDITRWQQRQNAKANFSASVPYNLEQDRETSKEFLDDLTARDQRMIFGLVTIVHTADSLEELDADTESLCAIGHEHGCGFGILRYQQEDGLNTVLPYGLRKIRTLRTLTTESTAVLMPFRAQEIQDPGGICYGVNDISKNLLICDRKRLNSPHAFSLGVTGSGKSVSMKSMIYNVALNNEDDDIIIIDAEREYGFIRELNGEIIEISPHSQHHINPLEVSEGYGEGDNPIAMKSELITSILEQQMGVGSLNGSHKSIIDRCTANVFKPYLKGKASTPLLSDWRKELLKQPEPEARELALAAELITEGSLNIFAHQTDVDMNNRIVAIDLYEMGEQLRPTALVVTLEAIQNRVVANRKKGKYTWVFIDEVYLYFKYHYSAEVLYRAWKRFRKYGGILTAATQNVEECLKSETARLMLANSEFLLLFNQAATDRQELAKLLHISDTQMGYVTDAEAGHGLLRMGGALVPFSNIIPKDTELYRLISMTPGKAE